eukprot:5439850-Pyramimonas_sp.AAC.1
MARRCEARISTWPRRMRPLSRGRSTIQENLAVAREVLDAPEYMLDSYATGNRALFNSADALTSTQRRLVFSSDFTAHCYGTDMVERLNRVYTCRHPVWAPGRNSVNAEREHFLGQPRKMAATTPRRRHRHRRCVLA